MRPGDAMEEIDHLVAEGNALVSALRALTEPDREGRDDEKFRAFTIRCLRLVEREFGFWNAYRDVLWTLYSDQMGYWYYVERCVTVLELAKEELQAYEP